MEVIVKGQPSIEIGFETKVIQVGGLGDIDSSLSTESENPVQNKVITEELGKKATKTELSALETKVTETDEKLTKLSQEKEDKTNKVTSLTEESTDEQYPSAKAVYALSERISENEILIEDLQNTKIDRENDDYYPKLAVGLADNLAGVDVVDSEVNFRRSGGGAISDGVARIESIKGNSVVWNQLFRMGFNTPTNNGVTCTLQNDNSIQLAGQLTNAYFNFGRFSANIATHKYLFVLSGATSALNGKTLSLLNRGFDATISNGYAYIFHTNSDPSKNTYIGLAGFSTGDTINETLYVNQYDLTKMFGAGNEPTTIEEFYARIPMGVDLNAYNEGEVIHMDVQSVESQGVNAWDEEWEQGTFDSKGAKVNDSNRIRSKNFIRIASTSIYAKTSDNAQINIPCYDQEKNYISLISSVGNRVITCPSNTSYIHFAYGSSSTPKTTYKNDICINLSDTSVNGKYFPYIKRVEDLSIIRKYFPQGMKSAGTAHDEIRYNKATQKWEMVQRIGEVDMGTFAWGYNNSVGNERLFTLSLTDVMQVPNTETKGGLLTTLYSAASFNNIYIHSSDKLIGLHTNGQLVVYDSAYTDAATFKAAMSGIILYYELAEPIVTELDAEDQFKDLDYQVWNCGTEKAIAEGKSAPLAADITYGFNAIGKIKELESLVAALRAKVGI